MTMPTISRRTALAAAVVTALATLTPSAGASTGLLVQEPLVLLDGTFSQAEIVQACSMLAPLQPRILKNDLVREWRDDLQQRLVQGVRAVAITRWDKALLLRGLSREAALPIRQRRIGRGLFHTEIG